MKRSVFTVAALLGLCLAGQCTTGHLTHLAGSRTGLKLWYRTFTVVGKSNGYEVPCDLEVQVENDSSCEYGKVTTEFTLLDGNQVIYSTPVTYTHFEDTQHVFEGSLLPWRRSWCTVRVLLPADKVAESDGYWFTPQSGDAFLEQQDLHVPGHWFSRITNDTPYDVIGLIKKDPSLAKEKDPVTGTPALFFAVETNNVALFKAFVHEGADPRAVNRFGVTPLHMAVVRSAEISDYLLKTGALIDAATTDGYTPLMYAVRDGCYDQTLIELLSKGANVNHQAKNGDRALSLAAEHEPARVIKHLLDHHASWLFRDHKGITPLHEAAASGNVEAIDLLVAAGEKPDECFPDNRFTPLMSAAKTDNVQTAAELIKKGANPNFKTVNHHTAYDLAVHYNQPNVAELLSRYTTVAPTPY